MPVVAFAFGSFGDIASVVKIAWELREALSDVTGASSEMQTLVEDLSAFSRALQSVDLAVKVRCIRPDVHNAIACALESSRKALRGMQARIHGLQAKITRAKGAAVWRQYWTVAAWSILGGRAEVDVLRARLFEQLGVIQTLLAVSECYDQDAVARSLERQGATIHRVYTAMHDIQLRFDVGLPVFHFHDDRTGTYYQPFARTSIQRLYDLYRAVNESPLELHIPQPSQGFSKTISLLRRCQANMAPCLFDVNCFFFKEAAFGEWQVVLGFPLLDQSNVRNLATCLRIFKALVERKHSIGAPCNCDGIHCHARFQREIQTSRYQRQCLECYSAAAAIVFGKAVRSYGNLDGMYRRWDRVRRGVERELTLCPDPEHVRNAILPLLRAYDRPDLDDMVRLFEAAPKLARPDGLQNPGPREKTLLDKRGWRAWHHNPVLRFWDLI